VTIGWRTAPRRFVVCAGAADHNARIKMRGPILDIIAVLTGFGS